MWFGGDAPIGEAEAVVLAFTLTATETEELGLGFATGTHGTITVDGEVLVDDTPMIEAPISAPRSCRPRR